MGQSTPSTKQWSELAITFQPFLLCGSVLNSVIQLVAYSAVMLEVQGVKLDADGSDTYHLARTGYKGTILTFACTNLIRISWTPCSPG